MNEEEDDIFFDSELERALIESARDQHESNEPKEADDFGDDFDDDLDLNQLVEVTETVEQQYAVNTGNISFVPPEDPTPPPALPESTTSFHPLNVENLRTWIYPTNYPVRGYQLNIVQKAMFSNTLVALPTGLGKTFIAAVVMYNYWRWFPNSFIIFMAPTRPLVTQQIEACFRICGLPQEDTCDISGTISPEKRRELYKKKRVFFATPQTINNDLKTKICPANKIVCLVVDEAHRATGNFAYCEVIKKLSNINKEFRVLALTATPGSKLDSVQNVITNLKIANIQIRTEESMDIREFTYGKNIQSIIVRLGYTEGSTGILPKIIQEFKQKVFEPLLKILNKTPAAIPNNVESVTTYGLTASRTRFTATADNIQNGYKFYIVKQILVAEQMSRAYDMLCQHGISPFLESVENSRQEVEAIKATGKNPGKAAEAYYNNSYITQLIPYLKQEMSKPDFMGHPKMEQLVGILLKHFSDLPPGASSKVMIFSSFRSSVTEICRVLDRHQPIIRSSFFVGQSEAKNGLKGLKQFEQQEVIQKFKRDEFNVLVATSIGEEGLDIGEVDLIICYDSQSSPIRMLQRMGRTGRKRQGKCIMLMTESEEKKFTQAKETYSRVQKLISQGVHLNYFKSDPSIIPPNYRPAICRKKLDIGTYVLSDIKKRRRTTVAASANVTSDGIMNEATERQFVRSVCDDVNLFKNLSQAMNRYWPVKSLTKSLNKYVPLQTVAKPTRRVSHSSRTLQLVQLVEKMENRILFPDKEIDFSIPKLKPKTQTKLVLPSKASTLKLPSKRKKPTRAEALDDAFADFMEQNDVSQFIDPIINDDDFAAEPSRRMTFEDDDIAEPSHWTTFEDDDIAEPEDVGFAKPSRRVILDDFFSASPAKQKKKPVNPKKSLADANIPRSKKGKEKMRLSQEIALEFKDDSSIENNDPSPLRDAFLPESVFEEAIPFENNPTSTTELKLTSSYNQRNYPVSVASPPKENDIDMDFDMDDDLIGDDFGDIAFDDDMFLAAENEALAASGSKGFDDVLSPRFPFEKNANDYSINHVTFVWTQKAPSFSEKALKLLEKRQADVKGLTGKFVAMNILAKYNKKNATDKRIASPIVISSQPQYNKKNDADKKMASPIVISSQPQYNQSADFGEDFSLGSDFLEQAAALENNTQKKVAIPASSIEEKEPQKQQSKEKQPEKESKQELEQVKPEEKNLDDEEQEEDEFGGFSDIDFDENAFANMIENKFSEDDGHDFYGFMPEEDQPNASQQATQLKEKQSYYIDSSPPRPLPKINQVENEEIYEIDFDDTPIPPGKTEVTGEEVYEYSFDGSADEASDLQLNTEIIAASPPRVNNSSSFVTQHNNSLTPRTSPIHKSMEVKSPPTLMQMSKGLAPSSIHSPLRYSPLRNNYLDDSDDSPMMPVRRKKRIIEESPTQDREESSLTKKPKKRLKRKASTPISSDHSVIELDDEDVVVFAPPSKDSLLERLRQSKSSHKKRRRIKQTIDDLAGNPFMDVEAERSSDEGHTSEEDEDGGSSILNSFIDDDSLDPESRISLDEEEDSITGKKKKKVNMYMQSLVNDDVRNSRHWMNRFDANKWLNTEEDSLIEEGEEEEEEEEDGPESVTEFSSHIVPHEDPVFNNNNNDDDDDFM